RVELRLSGLLKNPGASHLAGADSMIFGEGNERKELERKMQKEGRLPPGQSATIKWPVLHYGSVPSFNPQTWDFRIAGLVEKPVRLGWEEFNRLPQTEIVTDIHCVTRWSRFDNRWQGVPFTEVIKLATPKPEARFVLVDGEPLAAEHGYPLRLVVPHLYFWKSVKWVRGLELLPSDAPGFWEQNGYHM